MHCILIRRTDMNCILIDTGPETWSHLKLITTEETGPEKKNLRTDTFDIIFQNQNWSHEHWFMSLAWTDYPPFIQQWDWSYIRSILQPEYSHYYILSGCTKLPSGAIHVIENNLGHSILIHDPKHFATGWIEPHSSGTFTCCLDTTLLLSSSSRTPFL
jgi:hypothetical protein